MANVDMDLVALATMSPAQLRAEWQRLTRGPVPQVSPSMLRLALAWEIQAKAYGGLSRATQQKLDQLGNGKTRTSPARAGMRLVRAWMAAPMWSSWARMTSFAGRDGSGAR